MQFNDTTTYDGLVQHYEKWTRQPRGTVSGSNDLLKEFASAVNSDAFPCLLPILLTYNDQVRWDDLNHTDAPIGYINLVANQNDYKITTDDNALDILNVTNVRIKTQSSDTDYKRLERILADDPRVPEILSPDTAVTGTPSGFLELGNRIYLDVLPDTSITSGIEIFFGRQQSYFAYTDTTKEAGFPLPFHILLALYPALDWVSLNLSQDTNLINLITKKIAKVEKDFKNFIALRNPTKTIMTNRKINYI